MKELFREQELTRVAFFKTLLENEGIPTFIRNEALIVTEIQIPEFYPALCVLNDEDYQRAVQLIREHLRADEKAAPPEIACPSCGESSPGNFDTCWNCGASLRPSDGEPA